MNNDKLVAYFLGELSEEEEIRVESEYLDDEARYLEMRAAQDSLIDAYARGELQGARRDHFEAHFMRSPWAKERVDFARALAELPDQNINLPARAKADSLWASLMQRWHKLRARLAQPMPAWSFAPIVVIGTLGIFFLALTGEILHLTRVNNRLREQVWMLESKEKELATTRERADKLTQDLQREQNQRAQLEREAARQSNELRNSTIILTLLPGIKRDPGVDNGMPRLTITAATRNVQLQLPVRNAAEYKSYRAQLRTAEGALVLQQQQLPAQQINNSAVVVLSISADALKNDDYVIKLSAAGENGEYENIEVYSLRVLKQ